MPHPGVRRARAALRGGRGRGWSHGCCAGTSVPHVPRVSGDQSGRHRQRMRCHPVTLLQPCYDLGILPPACVLGEQRPLADGTAAPVLSCKYFSCGHWHTFKSRVHFNHAKGAAHVRTPPLPGVSRPRILIGESSSGTAPGNEGADLGRGPRAGCLLSQVPAPN